MNKCEYIKRTRMDTSELSCRYLFLLILSGGLLLMRKVTFGDTKIKIDLRINI